MKLTLLEKLGYFQKGKEFEVFFETTRHFRILLE